MPVSISVTLAEDGDTSSFTINGDKKMENAEFIILEIPYNLYGNASMQGVEIASNLKGKINSRSSITESVIPVYTYDTALRFRVNKENINGTLINFQLQDSLICNILETVSIYSSIDYSLEEDGGKSPVPDPVLKFANTKIPILQLSAEGLITDEKSIEADYFVYNDPDQKNSLQNTAADSGNFKIKVRGSTSKLFPKQSYSIKEITAEKKKTSLLGLPAETEWVLYAPYVDLSLMRNALAYRLHREMGNYSPRTAFCHLIINDDYRGIYVLTEKIKRDKKRVDIARLKKKDTINEELTGGYIVKIDKGEGKIWRSPYNSYIDTGWGKWFYYYYPSGKRIRDKQAEYIKDYISEFEHCLVRKSGWEDFIDINSFIDFMILMEVSKNVDAYRLSTFFHKDKNGKLVAGPLWDLNLSFGLTSYYDGYKTDGLMYDDEASPFWWRHFLQFDDFKARFVSRWKSCREDMLSDENMYKIIDSYAEMLEEESAYDAAKWKLYETSSNWRKYKRNNYQESIEYLKAWISQRNAYLDKVFSEL